MNTTRHLIEPVDKKALIHGLSFVSYCHNRDIGLTKEEGKRLAVQLGLDPDIAEESYQRTKA